MFLVETEHASSWWKYAFTVLGLMMLGLFGPAAIATMHATVRPLGRKAIQRQQGCICLTAKGARRNGRGRRGNRCPFACATRRLVRRR